MQTAWANFQNPTPIGISKDGRIIWSPMKGGSPNGYCDVDVCGGIVLNGFYQYASTFFSLYI